MGQCLNPGNADLVSIGAAAHAGKDGLIAKANKATGDRRPRRRPR